MRQTSAKCAAAQQAPTGRGKAFPLGVPCGMACGQALQPCGLTGGLTTGSRLRRTCTPIWMKEFKKTKRQQTKRFTIRAHSRAHSTCQGFTYLSGKSVQTNRATSFTAVVLGAGCQLSMDGRGAWRDNVFVERLWRTVKYEHVYKRVY